MYSITLCKVNMQRIIRVNVDFLEIVRKNIYDATFLAYKIVRFFCCK